MRYTLAASRARARAGIDGAELRGPITMVRRAPVPATVDDGPRAELRARLRHEAEQSLARREEEIDATPSSRSKAIAGQVAWAMPDPGDELGEYLLTYEQENDADEDRRGHGD